MSQIKISIAMATYNGAKYLSEQLDSFATQERLPDELIVCDDRSTDDTVKILEMFASRAPFPVYVYTNDTNIGHVQTFNRALSLTSGDLVFLADHDDVWFPEKLMHIYRQALDFPSFLLYMNDAALTDANLNGQGLTKLGQFKSGGIDLRQFVMGCCCAVRRELLELCLPIPPQYRGHDDWLVHFANGLGRRMIVPAVLQYYRRHGSNTSEFIGNSLASISRWTRIRRRIQALLSDQRRQELLQQVLQQRLLVCATWRAEQRCPEYLIPDLASFRRRETLRLQLLRERVALQRRCLPVRLFLGTRLLLQGRYSAASGVKSFLRDIWA